MLKGDLWKSSKLAQKNLTDGINGSSRGINEFIAKFNDKILLISKSLIVAQNGSLTRIISREKLIRTHRGDRYHWGSLGLN